MLDNKGFDQWAGKYDDDIAKAKGYPFEGYYQVLAYVHSKVEKPQDKKVLDIGIGTGLLTEELYKKGATIYGVDFSPKMIEEASTKMPNGKFYCCDITQGLCSELMEMKFNYIVSSYALHHLTDEEKIEFINRLKELILPGGKIILADVAFEKFIDRENCQKEVGEEWDSDEYYIVAESFIDMLKETGFKSRYTQISICGGVLELWV
ncbi:class I SAM-dependent DNA methyltransferase [Alkaliphilus transvaalensis]|uniref:class I SAM-dependent DNA methyltransferase n=1 Tax=Alkaliphilus transvaalensis TaxID=114628 RepID=UPI00047EFA98|nr:class I SAM-dependent methyltransferase [Alkaliphilus transvaalensis]